MFNKFIRFVGNKFGKPSGIVGKLSTKLMNIMNQKQYKAVLDNINYLEKIYSTCWEGI